MDPVPRHHPARGPGGTSPEPFEAAQVDGVNRWQELRYLTIPMLRPAIAVAVLLRFMGLVQSFAVLYAMTNGGPGTSTLTLNIYD